MLEFDMELGLIWSKYFIPCQRFKGVELFLCERSGQCDVYGLIKFLQDGVKDLLQLRPPSLADLLLMVWGLCHKRLRKKCNMCFSCSSIVSMVPPSIFFIVVIVLFSFHSPTPLKFSLECNCSFPSI